MLKGTLPLAILVNTMYQSVQGVTMSMTNPIQSASSWFRKMAPKRYERTGIHIKLISRLSLVNLKLEKLLLKSFNDMPRNTPKSMANRKGWGYFPPDPIFSYLTVRSCTSPKAMFWLPILRAFNITAMVKPTSPNVTATHNGTNPNTANAAKAS